MVSRNPNLDLIRASAITLVLIHHIGQFLPHLSAIAHRYTHLGAYGVDLFFVLSGWLIGSLYWQEKKQYGNLELLRFWGRRWLRTIPPYLAILPIAYGGVYITRAEPFNLNYLIFFQNYEKTMPFFLVSWSLCVEEHFYLLMPVLIALFSKLKFSLQKIIFAVFVVSFAARLLDPWASPGQSFGYAETASHLNLSGLVLGVWFSYLAVYEKHKWMIIQYISKRLFIPLLLGFLLIPFLSLPMKYYFADHYVVLLFGALLASLTGMPARKMAKSKMIYLLSITSYSIYLTHSIVLHLCMKLTDQYGLYREAVFPLWVIAILLVGYLVFAAVERPSISLRDRLIPRRKQFASYSH